MRYFIQLSSCAIGYTDPLFLVKLIRFDSCGDGGVEGNFRWGRLLRNFPLFLSKTWNWIVYLIPDAPSLYFRLVKGTQSAMGPRWPGHYFCQFEKRLPQPEIEPKRRIHLKNPLPSCLVFHSILDLLLKISFRANFYSSYEIVLSYLVKNSIQRNLNKSGEKRAVAGREKSPSFTIKY